MGAGSYRDPFLVDLINRFNGQAMARGAIMVDSNALPYVGAQGAVDMPALSASAVIQSTEALRVGTTDYGVKKKKPAGPAPPASRAVPPPGPMDDKNVPRYRGLPRSPPGPQVFDSPFDSPIDSPLDFPFHPVPACMGWGRSVFRVSQKPGGRGGVLDSWWIPLDPACCALGLWTWCSAALALVYWGILLVHGFTQAQCCC